jgi:hypothetical protein
MREGVSAVSQRDAVREMDADIHAAMRDAGIASDAYYRAPGSAQDAEPVRFDAYLDEGVQVFGEFGQVVMRRDELVIFHGGAEIAQRGRVEVEGTAYTLVDRIAGDASQTRWTVRRG